MSHPCYTQPEVRALLKVSRSTFERLLAAGQLPFVQEIKPRAGRPRYLAAPLDRYLSGEWMQPLRSFGARRARL